MPAPSVRCRTLGVVVFGGRTTGRQRALPLACTRASPRRAALAIDAWVGASRRTSRRPASTTVRTPGQAGGDPLGSRMDGCLRSPRGEPSPIYPRRYTAILGRVDSRGGPRAPHGHPTSIPCALAVEVADEAHCQFVRCHPVRFCRSCPLALSSVSLLLSYPVRSCPILST